MNRSSDILKELEEISPVLAAAGRGNAFTVPAGYFDTVAATVLASVKNEPEAAGETPDGYFDSLSTNILSKIKGTVANELLQLSPTLAGIQKVNPFTVPENYFEQVEAELNLHVKGDVMPSTLEEAKNLQPFEVPVGYFEQLSDSILQKVKAQRTAKVVTMAGRINAIWKYAAAAVFTGVLALGVYKYGATTPEVGFSWNESKFNQTLENLAEEDIIKYLEKNGTQEDVATLTSGIDEASLPDQEEYFTDDATLDKFLEEIELKN